GDPHEPLELLDGARHVLGDRGAKLLGVHTGPNDTSGDRSGGRLGAVRRGTVLLGRTNLDVRRRAR
ncbi:MAG: hypothetical protein ACXWX6_02270, partial [Actinomycetota bacterium]